MNKKLKVPLVSVIMPVYNAGDFLVEAIDSVLSQSYKNFEIIAVDDGSSDNSYAILKAMAREDKRLKVYRLETNRGLGSAANLAIRKAKGDLIARFDADDVMPENRLALQVEFLQKNPQVLAVGGQCQMIDDDGKIIGIKKFPLTDKEIRKLSFMMMSLQAGAMMVNRKLLPKRFIFYSSKYRYAEDHELLFKLLEKGPVANMADILLYYRQHRFNSTRLVNPKEVFHDIYQIRKEALKRGFQPAKSAYLVNYIENIIISFLPEDSISSVFSFLRGTRVLSLPVRLAMDLGLQLPRLAKALQTFLF